jgi:hypothetical protein
MKDRRSSFSGEVANRSFVLFSPKPFYHMENHIIGTCRNCGHYLPPSSLYCPQCGQKDTDGRLTFGQLMQEFLANLLNLDSKIFRTLGALCRPGKLTVEYFLGKHARYYHPVRLFIVAAGLLTAMVTITVSKAMEGDSTEFDRKKQLHQEKLFYNRMDSISQRVRREFPQQKVGEALDTMKQRFVGAKDFAAADSFEVNDPFGLMEKKNKKVAMDDMMDLTEDRLIEKYKIEGFWQKLVFRQNIRIGKSQTGFLVYMLGNILWMMLVMMPMLALVLKLLYIRRGYLYFEHLIFSFHTHTFVFLVFAFLMVFRKWVSGWLVGISFPAVGVYLFFAMRRFYGQGWLKTFVKFALANFLYFFLFIAAALFILLLSMLFF